MLIKRATCAIECRPGTPRRGLGLLLVLGMGLMTGCRENPVSPVDPDDEDPVITNPDWTEATHGNVPADYGVVFPQTSVNTITITVGATNWSAIRTDMRTLTGSDFGAGGGGGGGGFASGEPAYVPVTLTFNGKQWQQVGFRLKGNSSLSAAWRQGVYKLPFRLNFDRYEDAYPAFHNQRFHGFKELSASPGWGDNSLIREKIAADLFRLAGVPAARTAFYRVYIDFGAGVKYCGVYTMVEVIDDTMVEDHFGDDSGNIYKPESRFQTFTQSQFEKKNNETAADWSDVQSFISALNSSLRTSNAAHWRTNLEATFDVDHFLKYLAVNNAIVNWDAYGAIAHNYYLYNHPTSRLTWIPWDHNEALSGSPGVTGGTGGTGPGGGRTGLSLTMNEVAATWPLLRYVADDPVYFARYKEHMRTFSSEVFTTANVESLMDRYQNLIAPYVVGAEGEHAGYTYLASQSAFSTGHAALRTHVLNRRSLIATFLP